MSRQDLDYSDDIELAEKVELKQPSDCSSESCDKESSTEKTSSNSYIKYLIYPAVVLSSNYRQNKSIILNGLYVALLLGYAIYFILALVHNVTAAIPLVILTCSVLAIVLYEFLMLHGRQRMRREIRNISNEGCRLKFSKLVFVLGILFAIGFLVWLLVDAIMRNPMQLFSLFGFFIILLICIWGSKYPEFIEHLIKIPYSLFRLSTHQEINWRPVIWGIGLQFILGVIVLRSKVGYQVIKFIGDEIAAFMNYSEKGAEFVFGLDYKMHMFAFKVLPMIVFFSMFTNMLFYLGLMQWFIGKLSYITQKTLGTSAIESTVAVANIFVGMTESPLVVRPYLADLTKAEIHSVLTAGLGSIAFSVFGVFVGFKIDSVHLLTACVMSAPASLVVSRMLFPEKEKTKFLTTDSLVLSTGTERNIVEAAAVGASTSISLVANIAANLIAFLGFLAFVDSSLQWFGAFVGWPSLTFEIICGYVFMPVAFLMGADWADCFVVGRLFGVKTFLNEFVAYQRMGPFIERRLNGTFSKYDENGEILFMSERSEVIAIHALCGFCNISSLGIIIGGLSVLMPSRRSDIAGMAVRALIGGMLTCCMTASIAGFLFVETSSPSHLNTTALPSNFTFTTAST